MLVSYRKLLAVERANKESLSLKLRSEMHFMEEQLKAEQVIDVEGFSCISVGNLFPLGQEIAYGILSSIRIAWRSW